jgi:hypothetical protein
MGITFLRTSINKWRELKEECVAMQLKKDHIVNIEYWREKEKIADGHIANLGAQLKEMMDSQDLPDIT